MHLIDLLSWMPVERLYSLLERVRLERLIRKFKYCGKRIVLSKGLYVESPDQLYLADKVSIGPNVSVMGVGGVKIGGGTMLAAGVIILTTTHDSCASVMQETGIHKPVIIGANVWIGAGAIILPGVSIQDNSIVGAGAVVTHDVAIGEVVGGVPARVLWKR